jgi:hypothetical protein
MTRVLHPPPAHCSLRAARGAIENNLFVGDTMLKARLTRNGIPTDTIELPFS